LHFSFFGVALDPEAKRWFALDGKELCGGILKGDKRGDAVVQAVEHKERIAYAEKFYNGKKESEIPCVRELLKEGFFDQKITLDALHLNPETTKLIAENQGTFLIGVKENQPELLEELKWLSQLVKPNKVQIDEPEKGHGRIDNRTYKSITINDVEFDSRWKQSGFQTLVWVDRNSYNCEKQQETQERSYYISNLKQENENENELFKAVRNHWKIETNNYVRDVSLKEDKLRTKFTKVSKIMACFRTVVINFLTKEKLVNIRAQLDLFVDDFQILMQWIKDRKFL
jgi:predicted transposase YbfD/YdcC